jgi:ribosomal protein S18 acetylase RimI-like enzyme
MHHTVNLAAATERDAVLHTLMLAFATDPCIRYTFDKADAYLTSFLPFATAMGGAAFGGEGAWLADGGAAAALWLPPGSESDQQTLGALIEERIAPEKQAVLGQVVEGMGQYHPHEPHWYLAMIGVDPVRQGQGLGSALLKKGLERCDADGLPAYLESSNPKNVPLYERHGFEVMGLIQPADFPPLYPMFRPARR